MAEDPFYAEDWRDYLFTLRSLGDVDFADLIYVRSAYFVSERQRLTPSSRPSFHPLRREGGKIARANRGRDRCTCSRPSSAARLPRGPRPRRPDEAEARVPCSSRGSPLENRLSPPEPHAGGRARPVGSGPRTPPAPPPVGEPQAQNDGMADGRCQNQAKPRVRRRAAVIDTTLRDGHGALWVADGGRRRVD